MRSIYSCAFFLALALFPLGALYQPAILGAWAASPAAPIFFILALVSFLFKRSRREGRIIYLFIFWMFFSSIFSVIRFGVDTFYLSKGLAMFVLMISWIAPLLALPIISDRVLIFSVSFALLITLLGFVVLDLNVGPSEMLRTALISPEFHFIDDSRVKGFNSEPSHFSATVGRLLFVWFLLVERGKDYSSIRLMAFLSMFVLVMLASGSKGAALSILVMGVATFFSLKSVLIFFLSLPVVWLFAPDMLELLEVDIANFTSVSTRMGLAIAAALSFTNNPFGYGVYGFYPAVSVYGAAAIDYLPFFIVNLTELEDVVFKLESVSFKSTILDYIVVGGVPFLMLLLHHFRQINHADPRALTAFFYLIASGLYVEGLQAIGFFLLLGVVSRYFARESDGRIRKNGARSMSSTPVPVTQHIQAPSVNAINR